MRAYPLIFRFSAVVANAAFRARVRGTGRALAVWEEGEWWCSGVEPGGLTEPGGSPVDAYLRFRKTLGEILGELAEECGSTERFSQRVGAFFAQRDEDDLARWHEALLMLRRGELSLTQDVARLPRETARTSAAVEIEGTNDFHEQPELLSLADPEPLTRAA